MPQPFATNYNIVSIPATDPVTTPNASMLAIAVFLLSHVPPDIVEDKEVEAPAQTVNDPEIVPAIGNGLMVNALVAMSVPQLVVTV